MLVDWAEMESAAEKRPNEQSKTATITNLESLFATLNVIGLKRDLSEGEPVSTSRRNPASRAPKRCLHYGSLRQMPSPHSPSAEPIFQLIQQAPGLSLAA